MDDDSNALQARLEAVATSHSGGRSGGLRLVDGRVTLSLDVAGLAVEARDALSKKVEQALALEPGVTAVRIAMIASRKQPMMIAVGSGKGGVGKSTLTTNIALALRALGHRVGIVDADIYGPSQPKLLGNDGGRPEARNGKLVPVVSMHGVPFLSMGQLANPGQAIAWRGPMAGKALDQLIDAEWGDVDTLLIDLPPGTGDIQISMLQKFRPHGAIIVSTPQDLALIDAARAITLLTSANVPIIGMIENMAGYCCPACGHVSDPFGAGGAEAEADGLGLTFLGRIPLDRSVRLASDAGIPPVAQGGGIAAPFLAVAEPVDRWIKAARAG
jgi:ATP-binding protein involved in chromosome partitioning